MGGTKHNTTLITFILVALLLPSTLAFTQTQAEAQPAANEGKSAKRNQELIAKVWWNQLQKVEQLGLSETQRKQMDKLLRDFLDQRQERRNMQNEAFDAFGEALLHGNMEAIRQRGDQVVESAARPMREQVDMMIAVVEVMTPEQRQELVSHYPKMLSKPWIVTRSAAGRRRANDNP